MQSEIDSLENVWIDAKPLFLTLNIYLGVGLDRQIGYKGVTTSLNMEYFIPSFGYMSSTPLRALRVRSTKRRNCKKLGA